MPTEVAELIRQGVDAVLVPLHRPEGHTETFGIADDRIMRPVLWPASRAAQIVMLLSELSKSPAGLLRVIRRIGSYAGDDARGALVSTVQILRSAAGARPPKHIHAHFGGHLAHVAALLAAWFRCTWSVTAHAKDIYTKPERLTADFRDAAFVRTISRHGQSWVAERAGIGSLDRIPLIHCGVDTETLRPAAVAPASTGRQRLVSVGRLVPKKGHDLLVEAIARLRAQGLDLECDIIGDGPESERIRALVKARGLDDRVRLLGALDRTRMLQIVADAAAMVLASRVTEDGDQEGIPLALMEAMAFGTPVVAGDVGGTSELVDGAGVLFDGRSAESLAGAIQRVVTLSQPEYDAMRARCRRRVEEEFCLQSNVARLKVQLFEAMTVGQSVGVVRA